MTAPTIHWRRELADGGVEFCFAADGQKMSGSVSPDRADDLQQLFEQAYGVVLPEPEWKLPRWKLPRGAA